VNSGLVLTPDLVRKRVADLRASMEHAVLDAYVVPSSDPHMSEYLPARWQGRAWLSGFTGSVGTLVVTATFAGLWVDSRYWQQAERQLADTGIALMKVLHGEAASWQDWLGDTFDLGAKVGIDGTVASVKLLRGLKEILDGSGVQLCTSLDLLDTVWAGRPPLPCKPVREHRQPYATVRRAEKIATVRQEMKTKGVDWHAISALDDIAWLFNLRGADVDFNPVFVSHALIGQEKVVLFLESTKLCADLYQTLTADGISVDEYGNFWNALSALSQDSAVLIDPRRISWEAFTRLPDGVRVVEGLNPTTLSKATKTDAEIRHVRDAMVQDGLALVEFLCWLDDALKSGEVTELDIDERLTACRAKRPGFVSRSFSTIAGFNSNGAMPHYMASPEANAVINGDGLLLIDSGGQYEGGTTDITRVVPVGALTDEHKRDFTLVLKGMIALSRARFPRGVRSPWLDIIARAPMWAAGVDFGHGTGHGVGYFLNVHEGPQVITYSAPAESWTTMLPGMITSNEPGLYREGKWGVRIENLVVCVEESITEFGEFLGFETLTLCPIDTRCVDVSLLERGEIDWLNCYHRTVFLRLCPLLDERSLGWLHERTLPI
jgi:Xaa-Pro aminopeptidase